MHDKRRWINSLVLGWSIKPSHPGSSWPAGYLWAWWSRAWHGLHTDLCPRTAQPGMLRQPPAVQAQHGSGNVDPSAYNTTTSRNNIKSYLSTHNIFFIIIIIIIKEQSQQQEAVQHPKSTIHSQSHLEILSNFTDQPLERQFPNQKFCALLIFPNLTALKKQWTINTRTWKPHEAYNNETTTESTHQNIRD